MTNIVVVAAKRTPFGAFGGGLSDVSATDLGVAASKACMEQAQVSPRDIDHVIMGNVVQSAADAIYSPRHIGLKCGIPQEVGALGVNRLCGSGFQAWINAAHMLLCNEAQMVLAGGTEQMSQIPFIARGIRFGGYRMGHQNLEDYLTAALTDSYAQSPMAITAENLAEKYKISRTECDELAIRSQRRCHEATQKGIFATEIVSIQINGRKGPVEIAKDEHPKPDSTIDKISTLKPVFKKDGVVTAANASGIVDGAAASLLTTEKRAKELNLKPLARLVGWAAVGCDPKIMGIGPAAAIRKTLEKAQMKMEQMHLIEVNEAFAAQYLAVEKELSLNPEITNVNGGAIAIGHPLAASGTRIMNHLVYELQRRKLRYGLGSACIGGGQGIAILIENLT